MGLKFNLSFGRVQVYRVMKEIGVANNDRWQVSEQNVTDWAVSMADMLLTMLRHVQQARVKPRPPSWLEVLGLPVWHSAPRTMAQAKASAPPSSSTGGKPGDIVAGYDSASGKAYKATLMKGRFK